MEEVKETINTEVEENPNEEIDYKAEYEKLMAEKEKEKMFNSFKGAISSKGYSIDEEELKNVCNDYDSKTVQSFINILGLMELEEKNNEEKPVLRGITPVNNGRSLSQDYFNKGLTFDEAINK